MTYNERIKMKNKWKLIKMKNFSFLPADKAKIKFKWTFFFPLCRNVAGLINENTEVKSPLIQTWEDAHTVFWGSFLWTYFPQNPQPWYCLIIGQGNKACQNVKFVVQQLTIRTRVATSKAIGNLAYQGFYKITLRSETF